jgi:uncharacterized protein YjdB
MMFQLPVGPNKIGVWNYGVDHPATITTAALEAEILAGRTYVQIHSAIFPAGAIRGQILPVPNIQNMILSAGTKLAGTWSVVIPSITRAAGSVITIPVTATDGTHPVTAPVTLTVVSPAVLTTINVTAPASLIVGATSTATAAALDQTGAAMAPAPVIAWTSSVPTVASVNPTTGLVTAVAPGTSVITAASGAVSGSSTVTVSAAPAANPVLTSISLTPATATVVAGSSTQLTATAKDQNGAALAAQPVITFNTSSSTIATVDAAGLVTGVAAGTATITATSGTTTSPVATITVTAATAVNPVLTSITLTPATASVVAGAITQLTAIARDQIGTALATQPAITFSSSATTTATVSATGLVTGVAAGTATIVATSGTTTSPVATITVTAVPVVIPPAPSTGGGGGGGGFVGTPSAPTTVTSLNVPLTVNNNQVGLLTKTFSEGSKVEVGVPAGAVAAATTFDVALKSVSADMMPSSSGTGGVEIVGSKVFEITASPSATFSSPIEVFISAADIDANDVARISVFTFDTAKKQWVAVPAVVFDKEKKVFRFKVSHLSSFALLKTEKTVVPAKEDNQGKPAGEVLGVKIFADGTLIRTKNGKIFLIVNKGFKKPVASLEELRKLGKKEIKNVDDATFNKIPLATGNVLGVKTFKDGSLIRGRDGKVFIIEKGEKRRITSAAELKKFSRVKIESVDDNTLNSIRTKGAVRLLRARDGKIFVVENNEKRHVRSMAELKSFGGVKVESVDDNTLNRIKNKG